MIATTSVSRLPVHERAVQELAPQVTQQVYKLMAAIHGELTRAEIMRGLGLKDRMHFANDYPQPALDAGLIEMTLPDKPQSSKQKYRLTAAGRELLEQYAQPG
jgi:ATP-dependent DNA helicase RecG